MTQTSQRGSQIGARRVGRGPRVFRARVLHRGGGGGRAKGAVPAVTLRVSEATHH